MAACDGISCQTCEGIEGTVATESCSCTCSVYNVLCESIAN
ncbi:hypothetical protein [Vulgatibacter sp.]